MKPILKVLFLFVIFCLSVQLGVGQSNTRSLQVDASKSVAKIQPTMYGIFFEDINFAADGGIYAEMVKNRGFEFTYPKMGWSQPNSDRFSLNKEGGMGTVIKTEDNPSNRNFLRVVINNASGYELINEGFRAMGVKANESYDVSVNAAQIEGNISEIHFQFVDQDGKVVGKTSIPLNAKEWTTYESVINATDTEAKAQLKITFTGTGIVDLDMISVFPQDTWKGRKKGMRKDLVQLLSDLKPRLFRLKGASEP